MIQSFQDKDTEKIFRREQVRAFSLEVQHIAYRKLLMIDAAIDISDLKIPPGNRLELLKGNRRGQYSIRINKQWRICFRWNNGHAFDVEIIDYHS